MSFPEDKILILELGKSRINYKKGTTFFEDKNFEILTPVIKLNKTLLTSEELESVLKDGNLQNENMIENGIKENKIQFEIQTDNEKNQLIEEELIINIFKQDSKVDWIALRALLQYLLTIKYGTSIDDNDLAIIFVIPTNWPRINYEELIKITFDDLNFTAIYFLEQPLSSLYGYGLVSGTVVHLGATTTTVTPVVDNYIYKYAIQSIPIGYNEIDKLLLKRLKEDQEFTNNCNDIQIDLKLIKYLRENDYFIFDQNSNNEEFIEVEYKDAKFNFHNKHRLLINEILFNSDSVLFNKNGFTYNSIRNLIKTSIDSCDIEKRFLLWENIIVNGGLSKNRTFIKGIEKEISDFWNSSENIGYTQPNNFKFLNPPEYFRSFKESHHLLTFLGACITAKYVFADPKLHISQVEFNQAGPTIIYNKAG
ncbi:actin-like ATPase domain-containing protein [Neoconidiobolus thromboides FSU 785]|nr:actin-like ATPase domain-containing protein [Neoconidiobolus thromboides FSU 785]